MNLMQYRDFSPTIFDPAGAFLPDRQGWYVAPVSRNRDSHAWEESNFGVALELFGGESETIEVHRFGHWGPGWFEIILVDPHDEERVNTLKDITASLEDYPILDEMNLSERQYEEAMEAWENWYSREFTKMLEEHYEIDDILDFLDSDALYALASSLMDTTNTYWEHTDEGARLDLNRVCSALPDDLVDIVGLRRMILGKVKGYVDKIRSLLYLPIKIRTKYRLWKLMKAADERRKR